ncbi:uncharacterized protein [Littorina saxatilis]|uniref:uncharacterized protein n=1 Tax=Littorina saxatilis TaxID=31220 RepID=UPI0038B47AB9
MCVPYNCVLEYVSVACCSHVSKAPCNQIMLERISHSCYRVQNYSCQSYIFFNSCFKVTPAAEDPRRGCVTQFTTEEIMGINLSIKDMDRDALDMLILGLISSCRHTGDMTQTSRCKEQRERQKGRSTYMYMGRLVCVKTFQTLLGVSANKLRALQDHFKENGLTPRKLKSGGRKSNTNSLSLEDTQRVLNFIKQYAEDHAVSLPGRVPGFKRADIQLLPSSAPKSRVYRHYADIAARAGHPKVVAKTTFNRLWRELCPFIVVCRPMTDLCWRCQNNNTKIFRSANLTDEEKGELILEQQRHLSIVVAEGQFYKDEIAQCKTAVQGLGLTALTETAPNSRPIAVHYSFEFAQQVHLPSNAAQPGPMYFLVPRKCAIFGVNCEAIPQQVNFLVDESVNCSKGSTAVISYLHFFFEKYGLGEQVLSLHCDNCSGQNKNNFVMWYLIWRVMKGLHTEINVHFMPAGHTKFAPDWAFGLLKKCFRRSEVSCLDDLCEVVRESTPVSHVNIPQLVGREDGSSLVNTYDWQTFLKPAFKRLPGMLKFAHFRMSHQHPGCVFVKMSLAEVEEQRNLLVSREAFRALADMPLILPTPGLSRERQTYLFTQIREFVREDKRDVMCPPPN